MMMMMIVYVFFPIVFVLMIFNDCIVIYLILFVKIIKH